MVGKNMNEYNFLPEWYTKNKRRKKNIVFIIFIIGLLCSDLIMVSRVHDNMLKISETDKKIEVLKNKHENFIIKKNEIKINKDVTSLNDLKDFIDFVPDYVVLKNADFNNKTVNARIFVNKYDDYIRFIQYTEEKKLYNICKLTPAADEKGSFTFEISLEKI